MSTESDYFTAIEAAAYLKISVPQLNKLVLELEIQVYRIKGMKRKRYFFQEDIKKLYERSEDDARSKSGISGTEE